MGMYFMFPNEKNKQYKDITYKYHCCIDSYDSSERNLNSPQQKDGLNIKINFRVAVWN